MCTAIERINMLHKVDMYKIIKEITREKCGKIHKFVKRKVNTHNRQKTHFKEDQMCWRTILP